MAYVDDGLTYVASLSLYTNTMTLQGLWKEVISPWLAEHGLAADPAKCELMHFTTRRRDKELPTIRLDMSNGETIEVAPLKLMRWLGVYFDPKLLFNEHVKKVTEKAMKAAHSLRLLGNTTQGLVQRHLRQLYIACVRPIMTYGSPVWWTGKKAHEAQLTKVQNESLRLVCAVFRTTPQMAMEVDASIPPIRIQLDYIQQTSGIRLLKLHHFNPIWNRMPDSCRNLPRIHPLPPACRPRQKRIPRTRLIQMCQGLGNSDERLIPFLTAPWDYSKSPSNFTRTPRPKKKSSCKGAYPESSRVDGRSNEIGSVYRWFNA